MPSRRVSSVLKGMVAALRVLSRSMEGLVLTGTPNETPGTKEEVFEVERESERETGDLNSRQTNQHSYSEVHFVSHLI